jgi:hypothetical protein
MAAPLTRRLAGACAVVLSLSLSLAGVRAWAAPPAPSPTPSAADETEAKRHFEVGLKLYKEKVYDAALTEFETSYKLNARPSALRNVAQCHRDLKHFAEAHKFYEQLLAAHGAQLSAKEKEAVARALGDLKLLTGTVTVAASAQDASVSVDSKSVGATPLADAIRVDVGKHAVRVSKPGFETFETEVTIVAQQALTIDVKLSKEVKTGTLTVKEKSGGSVHVWIDDADMGAAPWTGDLSPGSHVIELKGPKLLAPKKTVEVTLKGTSEVVLEATALRGRLRVETLSKTGDIFIDGVKKGTGSWEDDLPPGTHEVRVEAEGFEKYVHLVAVNHGQTLVEAVTLVAKGAVVGPSPKDMYIGTYARFSLAGSFALAQSGSELSPGCDASGATCDLSKPIGGGAVLNVGYSFDYLAVEFVGAFFGDFHRDTRSFGEQVKSSFLEPGKPDLLKPDSPFQRTEKNEYLGLSWFSGIGGRVTSKDDAVRFTFGAALGLAYRSVSYRRVIGNDEWNPGAQSYLAPGLVLDAGLLLGDTPGAKFTLGILAYYDFGGTLVTPDGHNPSCTGTFPCRETAFNFGGTFYRSNLPAPPQTILSGGQFYIGPTLGLRFGR